jgi:MarR family 2-MHQ and catechol resistance regulon transcriptional repressor
VQVDQAGQRLSRQFLISRIIVARAWEEQPMDHVFWGAARDGPRSTCNRCRRRIQLLLPTMITLQTRRQPDSLQRDAESLHAALSDLVRVYQFRDRDRICCHNVSVTQCHAIETLVQRGPLSLNGLAAELFLEKSTASRVVATLERKGYVKRSPDRADRRAVLLDVTAAGRQLHRRIEQDLVEEEKQLLADVAPEVRAAAADLLFKLARAAEARSGRTRPGCCVPSKE